MWQVSLSFLAAVCLVCVSGCAAQGPSAEPEIAHNSLYGLDYEMLVTKMLFPGSISTQKVSKILFEEIDSVLARSRHARREVIEIMYHPVATGRGFIIPVHEVHHTTHGLHCKFNTGVADLINERTVELLKQENCTSLWLQAEDPRPIDLDLISRLPLSVLSICGDSNSDLLELRNFASIAALKQLVVLQLRNTGVSDRDLDHLRDLPIRSLYLNGSRNITDVSPLARLTSLESLSLTRTNVRDFSPLVGMKLKLLNLPFYGQLDPDEAALDSQWGAVYALRGMKSLRCINGMRPDRFWAWFDQNEAQSSEPTNPNGE